MSTVGQPRSRRRSAFILIAAAALAGPTSAWAVHAPFVPNDPYFGPHVSGNLSWGQWYLDKTGTSALIDINVRGAWDRGLTGEGVTIGIVDTGSQWQHPDLVENFDATNSWDFRGSDPDPSPSTNEHGTCVTGLAAARGGNGIGISGVAPHAKFAGLRVLAGFTLDNTNEIQRMAAAIAYHSGGGSTSIEVKNKSSGDLGAFGTMQYAGYNAIGSAISDYTSSGGLFVTIAQNCRDVYLNNSSWDPDTSRKSFLNRPDSFVTGAANYLGTYSSYSSFGSSVTVVTPSDDDVTFANGVLTTDMFNAGGLNPVYDHFADYNYAAYGGTSSAGPQLSGALALAIESHRRTFGDNVTGSGTSRYYKHLLAKTAALVDSADASSTGHWQTNAAGYHFNNNYGFGLLDTARLTNASASAIDVTPLVTASSGVVNVTAPLPSRDSVGIARSVFVAETAPLEEIQLRILLNEGFTGRFDTQYANLWIRVSAPSGSESVLSYPNPVSGSVWNMSTFQDIPLDWTYLSNAFWGENPHGLWNITVANPGYDSMEWSGFELITRHGSLITPTLGDANLDNVVNFDDLLALAQHYGTETYRWAEGDFDASGTVGFDDLLALAQHYGSGALNADGTLNASLAADWTLAQSLVPEPGALLTLGSAMLLVTRLVTRRRRARA